MAFFEGMVPLGWDTCAMAASVLATTAAGAAAQRKRPGLPLWAAAVFVTALVAAVVLARWLGWRSAAGAVAEHFAGSAVLYATPALAALLALAVLRRRPAWLRVLAALACGVAGLVVAGGLALALVCGAFSNCP